ncbi:MAG: capsule assembly Wzi family protein [Bacteroidales bacterium]|nr:capsule assembly Wzi family protein [Bacteroidales bacterium]
MAHNSQLTTHYSQLTTHYSKPTTHRSLLLTLLLLPAVLFGQLNKLQYEVEAGGLYTTGEEKAFWLLSNNDGRFRPGWSSGFAELKLGTKDYQNRNLFYDAGAKEDTTRAFHLDYGLNIINTYNGSNDFQLLEYFAEVSWKGFHLTAGPQKKSFGVQYDPLSSGGFLYSRNARPIPEIAVSLDYISIPYTFGLLEIKGYLSHGWFEKDRHIERPYYHHKNLYGRLGQKKWPVFIEYGFHHFAQWGGISPDKGNLFRDWEDVYTMFIATSGETFETINAYGNHLGSQNLKITYQAKDFSVEAFWQTIFEDGSGKRMKNIKDGLWGINFHRNKENAFIQNVTWEFMHTLHQSGRYHMIDSVIKGGNDNYFNNGLTYNSGWTYHGYIIGTPFITSPNLLPTNQGTRNNRVIMHHVGLNGHITEDLSYRTLFSFSKNYGTYANPLEPVRRQFSFLFQTEYTLSKGWHINAAVASDHGDLFKSKWSAMVSIAKTGMFR